MTKYMICIVFLAWHASLFAQTIELENPSFEDIPAVARPPEGWFDCGFTTESPPDVQPNGHFEVRTRPQHGKTYLGLIVRDNNTWESVGQELGQPLRSGIVYKFSLNLCKSKHLISKSKLMNQDARYTTPALIRIWGGIAPCEKTELLATSPVIDHTNWKTYDFQLNPSRNYRYFIMEAFYANPDVLRYNGNIMVDNASDIEPIKLEKIHLDSLKR